MEQVAESGDRLDLPGRPMVVATPGHTAGHASYLIEDEGALCSGDALATDGITKRGSGPQLLPEAFHTDAAQAAESLRKLSGLSANLLLPGHGEPWRGAISEAVARAGR